MRRLIPYEKPRSLIIECQWDKRLTNCSDGKIIWVGVLKGSWRAQFGSFLSYSDQCPVTLSFIGIVILQMTVIAGRTWK